VPNNENLKRKVTEKFHDGIMGHPGHYKTLELISREYWWPGITEFVKKYVEGCATCQATKIRPPVKVPLKPNEVPTGMWETITMDFITDLPKSHGYDSILTVVDRHSKGIVLSPCNKTITAEETSQLLLDNVWKRFGFPKVIISDRGPQFTAQVTQELWRKLGIKQKMSTAFHPQTDGESERVNQEIEQYLRICGNFQQDDWAQLLPIIEFAHNARTHRSTHKSPFEVWYGFHPTFQPPPYLQTRNQKAEERVTYLEQIRKEVTAALLLAAKEMRNSGPPKESHVFHDGDQVWLDGTNLQTTHPKWKLAPRRHGPFKVTWASPTNCKLELPKGWNIHPVFHNSLLKPYVETMQH
jgi:transposase InsO family protein